MRARRLLCTLLVPALAAVGCGGSDDDEPEADPATTTTAGEPAAGADDPVVEGEGDGDGAADQEAADRAVASVTDDLVAAGFERSPDSGDDPEITFETEACDRYELLFNGGELDGQSAFAEPGDDITKTGQGPRRSPASRCG